MQSEQDGKYYTGSTQNLNSRLDAHNRGSVKSTKHRRQLRVVYFKEYESRSLAVKRE